MNSISQIDDGSFPPRRSFLAKIGKAFDDPSHAFRILVTKFHFLKSAQYFSWKLRGFAAPSPNYIMRTVILRNGLPNSTWIETGTYLGETTELLSRNSKMVHSLEPEPKLFARARDKFSRTGNIEIINGTSEDVFPSLLARIQGDVNFWLDGHSSGGPTFSGALKTPIVEELNCIAEHMSQFEKVTVLVDDLRLFGTEVYSEGEYPSLNYLVDWARNLNLGWHIEHDIFIAKNY